MKFLIAVISMFLLTTGAQAADLSSEPRMDGVNKWLDTEHLVQTITSSGRDDLSAFMQGQVVLYGEGVGNPTMKSPAQRRLSAETAAEISAYRNAVEYMESSRLVGESLLKDIAYKDDTTKKCFKRMLAMFEACRVDFSDDIGIVVLRGPLFGQDGILSELFEMVYATPELRELIKGGSPSFVPRQQLPTASYDGLIVDTMNLKVEPAVFNRLYTRKGDLLYSPLMVPLEHLIDSGGITYTDSVVRARQILSQRGVTNPLVVKALKSTSVTDVTLSDEDALKIYAANQRTQLFSNGNVALVFTKRVEK